MSSPSAFALAVAAWVPLVLAAPLVMSLSSTPEDSGDCLDVCVGPSSSLGAVFALVPVSLATVFLAVRALVVADDTQGDDDSDSALQSSVARLIAIGSFIALTSLVIWAMFTT
jgi:hypothetical protein